MAHHLSFLSGKLRYSTLTFDASLSTQVLEKLISRTHDLVQRFPGDPPTTSHNLLLELAEALGTLVNSGSVDILSTGIGEALLTLCLTAPVINGVRDSEIFHALIALEKLASPRLFASLILKASPTTFDHITGCCISTLRSHHLINLAKALEHTVASFRAGDVPHRRSHKRKREGSLGPGPGRDSDEWEERAEPEKGKPKHAKVKVRNGTPSESSVSGLEDAGQQKRVKRPRVKVTYQPSESGTEAEDDSPVHPSGNEDTGKAFDQDKEMEDECKPINRNAKGQVITPPLESSRQANAQWSTDCRPRTKRGHAWARSKILLPQPNQVIKSRSATPRVIQPVLDLKASSAAEQETHRSCLSSDDDLNLFACSSPR